MITEDEKIKIKAEEIFRDEVRKSLNPKKRNFIWGFLNSVLGIWFLSTIVIGLFTYFFNDYEETKKMSFERETKIEQLDLEIESRISQFWVHLNSIVNHSDTMLDLKNGLSYDTVKVLWEAFKNPPSFNPKVITTIYKDYETRSTISLMIELSTLLKDKYDISTKRENAIPGKAHSTIIKMTRNEAVKVKEVKMVEYAATFIGGNGIFYKSDTPSIQNIWQSFKENIIAGRWNYSFPYTDCLFC